MFAHTKASRALAALSDPLVSKSVSKHADGTNQTPTAHREALRR
jgi:hypothetical protein